MFRRPVAASSTMTLSVTTATTTLVASSIAPILVAGTRHIRKQHNYRHERNHKLLGQRYRYARNWEFKPGVTERYQTQGHELEAFENFGRYKLDSTVDSSIEVCTHDLLLIEPRERFAEIAKMIQRRDKVRDGRAIMERLRLTVLAAECFEEMCIGARGADDASKNKNSKNAQQQRKLTMNDLEPDDQFQFHQCVYSIVNIVNRARRDHPDSIAAVMRAVQMATNMRDDETKSWLLKEARQFVNEMQISPPAPPLQGNTITDGVNFKRLRAENYAAQPPLKGRVDPGENPDELPNLRVLPPPLELPETHIKKSQKWPQVKGSFPPLVKHSNPYMLADTQALTREVPVDSE